MAVCKFCGKKTGLNHYCTQHKQQYYHERFPDHTCLWCNEQLYPNGVSHSQFLKQIFCSADCRGMFLEIGLRFAQPVVQVKDLERTVTTIHRDDEYIQLVEDLVSKKFYTLIIVGNNQTKSDYFATPKEAVFDAMEERGWI